MTITFSAHAPLWYELLASLDREEESAGVILAGIADDGNRLTLCANAVRWVPDSHYLTRTAHELVVPSAAWMPALRQACDEGWLPIWFHTHPGGRAAPSIKDDAVEAALSDSFPTRAGCGRYASLILAGTPERPTFSGRLIDAGKTHPIDRVRVAGPHVTMLFASRPSDVAPLYDRQVRAFGAAGQAILQRLRVGLAGAGGTGSATFEQLIRKGIGEIVCVDDDVVSETNVTRIYGSRMRDVGEAKVDVLARHAADIGLGTTVETHTARITDRAGMEALRTCDVVFGCTDDEAGRAILSRLAYYYLVPVIDMGVVIDARAGEVHGVFGRVTVMAPGEPCLACRGRIDPVAMRNEALGEEERQRLAAEGYAPGLGEPDPAVVAYTTAVSAAAVSELLERLFGFGDPQMPGELLLRLADRKTARLPGEPAEGHFCGDRAIWGRGDREPSLDQLWL
jgi:molybdopterin/thiamine biosynthesis adenylyltransferase/proteasome lid subunit RPN8/RPN11